MFEIVVADTSSLIAFDKLDLFHLFSIQYERVMVTTTVKDEFGKPLPNWIEIENATNISEENRLREILDPGEATAIALAEEIENCEIILDDKKARKLAERLGLNVIGTVAILERGYDDGSIPANRDIVAELEAIGFRISEHLKKYLRKAGEP